MKQNKKGLGKYIHLEWLVPITDYYKSVCKKEVSFNIIIPLLVAIVCTYFYKIKGLVDIALHQLADLLPTVISILIGFTVMLITLLLTSSGENIKIIKEKKTKKKLRGNAVSLYQDLLIQFTHLLFSEIILLLVIFLYLFLEAFKIILLAKSFILALETYFTLNILFSIIIGITNMYFSFYKDKN